MKYSMNLVFCFVMSAVFHVTKITVYKISKSIYDINIIVLNTFVYPWLLVQMNAGTKR